MKHNKFMVLFIIGIIFGNIILLTQKGRSSEENPSSLTDTLSSPLSHLENPAVSKNYFAGVGENFQVGIYTNVSVNYPVTKPFKEDAGYKFFDVPINTYYQNITQTTLSFTDIEAHTTLIAIEENPEDYLYYGPPYWIAASIRISTPCVLRNLQLFVQESNQTPQSPNWIIELYNATRLLGLDLNIYPDQYSGVMVSQQIVGTTAAHWHNFTFPDVQLNMTNTYVDAQGFAYYYFKITIPELTTDSRYLYYSHDKEWIDDQWVILGLYSNDLLDIDLCMRVELAPLNFNASPSDVLLSVQNTDRSFYNLAVETNHSVPVQTLEAVHFFSGRYRIPSQNFNLTDYGTIYNISLYLKYAGGNNSVTVAIFPSNYTGTGPLWEGNRIIDGTVIENIPNGFEGWCTFSMREFPNLPPGQYWWILLFQSDDGDSNLTLYGSEDPPDKATALNITIKATFETELLDYNFASVIGIQNGRDFYNVTESWISDEFIVPDVYGYHHYTIVTRWGGTTRFNVTYCVELENVKYIGSNYYTTYQSNEVLWNLTLQATFLSTDLGKSLKLTIPLDWNVRNVSINGKDHGDSNWTIYPQQVFNIIWIDNCSNGQWTIWCNSSVSSVDFNIEKWIDGKYQSALNATIYDDIRINITIANQSNGMCYLKIFYPDNKSNFLTQNTITSDHITFLWTPETDPAATGGSYIFIVAWSNGTKVGYKQIYFLFTPILTTLSLASVLPIPYVNDITKTIIVQYNDSRGVNISGASLSAKLHGISLDWEDIYSRTSNPQDVGLYRIKLNTSGLHANQYYSLSVSARKIGYNNASLQSVQILVGSVPTSLLTNVANITQYQNEYISFSCSYKDNFHNTGIDWASVNYTIIGTNISGVMTNIMPGESIYAAMNVKLHNLTWRATPYFINLTASALDCQTTSVIINLFVLNKTAPVLTISTPSGPFLQGQTIQIWAQFKNQTVPYYGIANATIRFSFGGILPDQIALTDINGIARVEISIPDASFTITAFFDESYSINSTSTFPLLINVLSYADLILWIGIIAAACVTTLVALRQFYIIPKRNRKSQEYQKIANKFEDAANILQILIQQKDSGVCIFQQSFGPTIDGDLISGFLSAISSFQEELKVEKAPQKALATGGFELHYKDYRILLFEGTYIRLAFVVQETPSAEFRSIAQSLVGEFEAIFHQSLEVWTGEIERFQASGPIIEEKLELSLLWPHEIRRPAPSEKLSSTELAVLQIADTMMNSLAMKHIFLPTIISVGQAGTSQSALEIAATVYSLRQRRIFNPIDPRR
ncbi:MAG: hypothetical protein EU536_04100 [Promethearchaeota archaeon]|nr:MAG: hypothetical protein EU536_04100 [Candidatus Lokiarchaeota archaeon]